MGRVAKSCRCRRSARSRQGQRAEHRHGIQPQPPAEEQQPDVERQEQHEPNLEAPTAGQDEEAGGGLTEDEQADEEARVRDDERGPGVTDEGELGHLTERGEGVPVGDEVDDVDERPEDEEQHPQGNSGDEPGAVAPVRAQGRDDDRRTEDEPHDLLHGGAFPPGRPCRRPADAGCSPRQPGTAPTEFSSRCAGSSRDCGWLHRPGRALSAHAECRTPSPRRSEA